MSDTATITPENTAPASTAPITKVQILDQLKSRAKDLLQKLEGYQAIEEEFKLIARAIKVLSGEQVGPGRPLGSQNGDHAAPVGSARGSKPVTPALLRVLQLVADGNTTSEQMAAKGGIHIHNYQSAARELEHRKLLSSTSAPKTGDPQHYHKVYTLTPRGVETLDAADPAPAVVKQGRRPKRKLLGITSQELLPLLAQYPQGLTNKEITEKLNGSYDVKVNGKVSVMVCHWRGKKLLVTNKQGSHTLTAQGKQRVAEILAEN